jgi:hypothetical protein
MIQSNKALHPEKAKSQVITCMPSAPIPFPREKDKDIDRNNNNSCLRISK